MPTLSTIIQHSFDVLAMEIREEKEIKRTQIGKKVKLSLFADVVILCIENPKDVTRKLLELIHPFSEVSGYKINIQKSFTFLYSLTRKDQKEKLRKQPIYHCNKKTKIPRNNPT